MYQIRVIKKTFVSSVFSITHTKTFMQTNRPRDILLNEREFIDEVNFVTLVEVFKMMLDTNTSLVYFLNLPVYLFK